jgi:hypothetical protein
MTPCPPPICAAPRRLPRLSILAVALFLLAGCRALLPSSKEVVDSPWNEFEQARTAYDRIVPGETGVAELKELGFDIVAAPNLQILNYLDVAATVQAIPLAELDTGLQQCLRARNDCRAYLFEPRRTQTKRIGNFWLDFFNFRRETDGTGWRFKALLVLVNDQVTYKVWSGAPKMESHKDDRNPLGPLQSAGDMLLGLFR